MYRKIPYIFSRIIIFIFSTFFLYYFLKRVHTIDYNLNTKYSNIYELKKTLNTGDIICFYGDCYDSRWVKFFKNSKTSHCGMIVRDPYTDELYVWNNTVDIRNLNITSNMYMTGCQLNCFEQLISLYQGKTAIRKLYPSIQNNIYIMNKLKEIINKINTIEFTNNPWRSFFCSETSIINPPDFYEENWCSWLILYTYQLLNIINKTVKGHMISTDYFLSNNIKFNNNYKFSDTYYIKA